MFFSYLARIVAILGLLFGLLRVVVGFTIAREALGPYAESLARYAPGYSSSGEVMDKGFLTILFAIAIGTLAEISFTIRKQQGLNIRQPD